MATDVNKLKLVDNRRPKQALHVPAKPYVLLFRRELEDWLKRKAGKTAEVKR